METSLIDPEEAEPVADLARKHFGIDYLFPLQRMSIANILDAVESESPMRQLVLFPTGFGKSICFQLPALLAPGPTVVVYPLLALMNDQKNSLDRRGIPSAMFRGGLEDEDWRLQCEAVESGKAKIVITNPECLVTPRLKEFLAGAGIFHLAIDEAHCVSEWGETFRPSYLRLGESIEALKPKALSAFTATASPTVADAIARYIFGSEAFCLLSADIDKSNIRYSVEDTLSPFHTLLRLIFEKPKPLIVFDQSRDGVRRLCEMIHERSPFEAKFYHAGLTREEKNEVEAWFMASTDGILIATCAYGLGVDKRDIRTVIHFREPQSVEAYIQESGRGGRDGKETDAILIHCHTHQTDGQEAKVGPGAGKSEDRDSLRESRRKAFLLYASSQGCRREKLHSLMGAELSSPCSGCDICDGTARPFPEGLPEIREFFRLNNGRFDKQTSLRLLGQPRPECYGISSGTLPTLPFTRYRAFQANPPICTGAGLLSEWDEKDAAVLMQEAIRTGILAVGKGFPRKNMIRLGRKTFQYNREKEPETCNIPAPAMPICP